MKNIVILVSLIAVIAAISANAANPFEGGKLTASSTNKQINLNNPMKEVSFIVQSGELQVGWNVSTQQFTNMIISASNVVYITQAFPFTARSEYSIKNFHYYSTNNASFVWAAYE